MLPMKCTATTKLYGAHLKFGLDKALSDLIDLDARCYISVLVSFVHLWYWFDSSRKL